MLRWRCAGCCCGCCKSGVHGAVRAAVGSAVARSRKGAAHGTAQAAVHSGVTRVLCKPFLPGKDNRTRMALRQTRSITDSLGASSRQSGLHSWHVRPRSFRTDWRRKKQNCTWHLWPSPVTCGHFHVASAAGCSEHSHNHKCSKRIHPNKNNPGKYTWSR